MNLKTLKKESEKYSKSKNRSGSSFVNEKGNEIIVSVEKNKSKDNDLEQEIVIKLIGPKSESENIITILEAKKLNEHLSHVLGN